LDLFLPFDFSFYCSAYNKILLSLSGGYLLFNATADIYLNLDGVIPDPNVHNDFITAFSNIKLNLEYGDQAAFHVFNDASQISFQWTNWNACSFKSPWKVCSWITLQVSLFPNNSIIVSYLNMEGINDEWFPYATVGVQSGGEGVLFPSISRSIFTGLCIHFSPQRNNCKNYTFETYRCPESTVIVTVCPAGQFLGPNMLCEDCAAGKYQTGEGMLFESNCSLCTPGKYSTAPAASAAELCLFCDNLFSDGSSEQDTGCEFGAVENISNFSWQNHQAKKMINRRKSPELLNDTR
jgi:hypothetical protein